MISDDPLPTFSGAQNSLPYSEGEAYPSGQSWWSCCDTWSSQRFEKREFIFSLIGHVPWGSTGLCSARGRGRGTRDVAGKMLNLKAEPLQGEAQKVRMVAVYTGKKPDSGFAKTGAERSFTCPGTANSTARTRTHTSSLPAQPEFQHITPFTTTLPIHPGGHITPHSPQV